MGKMRTVLSIKDIPQKDIEDIKEKMSGQFWQY